ncbi:MAG: Rrf2 family transcriptional regulator [Candidatus Kapaibacterium sp.]|nr:MAG: Rrf2 family transcriptional regulator [Candidatus Kapabacteria bacterium]
MFSKACIYGIQAAIYLAQQHKHQSDRAYIPVVEIAQTLDIPFQFLKKVIQQLGEKNVVQTQRSAKGGVSLARQGSEITVFEVIVAIDGGAIFLSECILKFPGCGNEKPCPMHHQWAVERVRLKTMFEKATLDSLAGNVSSGLTRLGFNDKANDQEE